MRHFILFEKVAKFPLNNEISARDIWRNIEHITHLTANGEICIDAAEHYTYLLFRMLDKVKPC